jgi:hypothetical protein
METIMKINIEIVNYGIPYLKSDREFTVSPPIRLKGKSWNLGNCHFPLQN